MLQPAILEKAKTWTAFDEEILKHILVILTFLWLSISILLPLTPLIWRSLCNQNGEFVGFLNYWEYFNNPTLSISFKNSMTLSITTAIIAVVLAFGYAFALTRTCMPLKGLFRLIALLPLYAPSLTHGIGLVYLFGKKGLITTGFGGFLQDHFSISGIDINLYGMTGMILGELLFIFPQALMILVVASALVDQRLYEASISLKASSLRTFFSVTLPSLKYGIISSFFVSFTLVFTDFGVPKVVGGNENVLATDIYKQVIGQQNFSMGATISVLLLIPTVIAFLCDQIVQRSQMTTFTSKSLPLQPKNNTLIDSLAFLYCLCISSAILIIFATVFFASLVEIWPYNLALTLRHFDFSKVGGGGYSAFFNSLQMAFYTAVFGTAITFIIAYVIEKINVQKTLRTASYFLSLLPMALPGLVIGIAYIFFFNPKVFQIGNLTIPNPFSFLYNTMAILVLANIVHFFTVSFMTATTALKQLDKEFEAVSASLGVPFYKTFYRITLPICLPPILDIGIYYFVNAMVTVSAVIFLYSTRLKLASVAIVNMDDAGDTAAAAAMSVLIILASLTVRGLYHLLTKNIEKRHSAWKKPKEIKDFQANVSTSIP